MISWIRITQALPVFSQIHENYVLKSTEGLSIWFIMIWLGGDMFNLVGGLLQGVLLTMVRVHDRSQQINLAGYYCICDLVLIYQWWYYGKYYDGGLRIESQEEEALRPASETTPLLGGRARSFQNRVSQSLGAAKQSVVAFFDRMTPLQFATFKYSITLGFVVVTGVVAWFSADKADLSRKATDALGGGHEHVPLRWDAQVLGWLSAVLYILSRIPQIFKNRHTKCAGLSLALFVFAVGGNVTYVLVRACY